MFPCNLIESTYPDPQNPDIVLGRSEIERRREYIVQLEKELLDGEHHPLTLMVKQCLQNAPSRRPTAEQLVLALEGIKSDIEGPYGNLAKLDAVRKVTMMKELLVRDAEVKVKTNELEAKDNEIQQLQQQLQV